MGLATQSLAVLMLASCVACSAHGVAADASPTGDPASGEGSGTRKPPPAHANDASALPTLSDGGSARDSAISQQDSASPREDASLSDSGPAPDTGPAVLPTKKRLNVSWSGQELSNYAGPAAARMALSTRLGNPPTQTELATVMHTSSTGTADIGLVVGALNQYLSTSNFRRTDIPDCDVAAPAATSMVKGAVLNTIGKNDFPMVAHVISGFRPSGYPPSGTIYNYVAVVGYDKDGDSALIADPGGFGAGGLDWFSVAPTYWITTQDLTTWICGKGFASF